MTTTTKKKTELEYPKQLVCTQTIHGEKWIAGSGPIPAKIMILGQNPSTTEAQNNKPFSSKGASLLKASLAEAGIDWTQCYFTYGVKYPTFNDKAPKVRDISNCRDVLEDEIKRVNPDLIIPMGTPAFQAAMGQGHKISTSMGSFIESNRFEGRTLYPVWSPNYILRNPQLKYQYTRSFKDVADYFSGTYKEDTGDAKYTIITSIDQFAEYLADTAEMNPDYLVIDCEWEGDTHASEGAYLRTLQINRAHDDTVIVQFFPDAPIHDPVWEHPDIDVNMIYPDCVPLRDGLAMFYKFITATKAKLVGHNIRADGRWLKHFGCSIQANTFYDTMLAEHLIDNTGKFDLTSLTLKYTKYGRYDAGLHQWCKQNSALVQHGYGAIPAAILYPYGALDVEAPRYILEKQLGQLDRILQPRGFNKEFPSLFDTVMQTALDLYELEETGIIIDTERMDELIKIYHAKRRELENTLVVMASNRGYQDFNHRSVQQVRKLLFDATVTDAEGNETGGLGLTPILATGKPTKRWEWVIQQPKEVQKHYAPSTNQQTLEILQDRHPAVKHLLDIRRIDQVCKNFLREDDTGGIKGNIWVDGRLHPEYNQLTDTGRFSTRRPNCQNWSKSAEHDIFDIFGDPHPYSMRSIGIPGDGWCFIESDFKQAELFVLSGISGDKMMTDALTTPGKDLHDLTAISSFKLAVSLEGKPVEEQWLLDLAARDPEEFAKVQKALIYTDQKGRVMSRGEFKDTIRVSAKAINFGIPYGRGAAAIATQIRAETGLDVDANEIKQGIDGWKATYHDAWGFLTDCQSKVKSPGYVETPWGRRRYFPRVDDDGLMMAFQREAANFPIQSTVADTMRLAMTYVIRERDRCGLQFRVANQIHDALLLVLPEAEVDAAITILKNQMGNIPIPMPTGKSLVLGVDIDIHTRWGEKLKSVA